MNDVNKLISKDVSKLSNERPCKDAETLLSCNITEWIEIDQSMWLSIYKHFVI